METENLINTPPIRTETQSLKLYKNSSAKGNTYYNWEIKILSLDVQRLKEINEQLKNIFLSESE